MNRIPKSFKSRRYARLDESKDYLGKLTKKELLDSRGNWKASRAIRDHAKYIYEKNNGSNTCFICGYSRHIEIAHEVSVKDFALEALLRDINAFHNLVALCPNHHWEFNNRFRKL